MTFPFEIANPALCSWNVGWKVIETPFKIVLPYGSQVTHGWVFCSNYDAVGFGGGKTRETVKCKEAATHSLLLPFRVGPLTAVTYIEHEQQLLSFFPHFGSMFLKYS
jgi:hypothetical protein